MRNARILARMVASTLAAAVLVAGMATSASATPDTGWKTDTGVKHTSFFQDGHRLVEPQELETRTLQSAPRQSSPAIPQAVSIEAGGV